MDRGYLASRRRPKSILRSSLSTNTFFSGSCPLKDGDTITNEFSILNHEPSYDTVSVRLNRYKQLARLQERDDLAIRCSTTFGLPSASHKGMLQLKNSYPGRTEHRCCLRYRNNI